MVRHAPIHRRSGHSDIAICCGRNVRGSSPSTSVVPLSNQVTTLNHKRFKGFKMFSDGHLSVRHDFWPRPLSVGTHPTVTTCKPNTEKTPRFLRIREGSSLGRLVMTGVGALTRSLPLRRRDFRGAETLRQSAGVTRESARG